MDTMTERPFAAARLEVDLSSVQANYRYMRGRLPNGVTVISVVKSDAYGLGLVPVSTALHAAGCHDFLVADIDEGLALRAALPDVAIAVLRPDIRASGELCRAERLTPVVHAPEEIARIAATPFVLNVDTGFSRLGLSFDQVRSLYVAGVFRHRPPHMMMTHLACSETPADPLNVLQRNRFAQVRALLPGVRTSIAASAGVWLSPAYFRDAVRIGSALYGLNNAEADPNPLARVIRLEARILNVQPTPAGEAVGYAATFRTQRPSRIAVLGIGYAQGLPWRCANRLFVSIGPFKAPVVGRISMEYVTVDVTDVPESIACVGAWAAIIGDDLPVEDVADAAGVNPQEILVRLGGASPRCYRSTEVSWKGRPAHSIARPYAEGAPRDARLT